MKKIILGFFLLAVAGSETNAQPLTGTQMADSVTLVAAGCYNLQGCYVVPSGKVLTIQAGTVIRCSPASNLVVERGGVIVAQGTPSNQIVFTSNQPIGDRKPADWGSLIIMGKAKNNVINNGGGVKAISRCGNTYLGGGIDDLDNSGVLKYIRLEYAGGGISTDNEKSALILNSVGSGTTIDHVQITESAENGLSIFGGTVNFLNGYILDAYKNDVLVNLGYRGTISGLLTMRKNPAAHHPFGSNGLLVWNNDVNDLFEPLTQPEVLNCSIIGIKHCYSGTPHTDFKDGIRIDNNGGGNYYNNVITGYNEYGLFINDAASADRTKNPPLTGNLNFSYNSMTNNGSGDYANGAFTWSSYGCGTTMTNWIKGLSSIGCEESGNQFSPFALKYDASFCSDFCVSNFSSNFVLDPTTALEDPNYDDLDVSVELDYRGAVQGTSVFDSWITVCPQNQVYCSLEMKREVQEKKSSLIIIPNPAKGQASLSFDAKSFGQAKVLILDKVTGRVLYQKEITIKNIGEQTISISLNGLTQGVYPIRVQMKDAVINGMISVQ